MHNNNNNNASAHTHYTKQCSRAGQLWSQHSKGPSPHATHKPTCKLHAIYTTASLKLNNCNAVQGGSAGLLNVSVHYSSPSLHVTGGNTLTIYAGHWIAPNSKLQHQHCAADGCMSKEHRLGYISNPTFAVL
jgi:hypothetical protein